MAHETIQIVEDDKIIALHLCDVLTSLGYTVPPPIASGEKAVKTILSTQPDLVLLDIELDGGMSGIAVANAIRTKTDIPIVFLADPLQDFLIHKAKETAPYGYLTKPVPERELSIMIELTLSRNAVDRRLKESKDRFHAIAEYSPDAIYVIDENAQIIWVNTQVLGTSGYTREQFFAADSFFMFISPDSMDYVLQQYRKFLAGEDYDHYGQFGVIRADGEKRIVEYYATQYTTRKGGKNLLITLRDITEHKQLEERFFHAQKMETVGRLAGGIAHDFNNILTIIRGNAEMALMSIDATNPCYDMVMEIKKAGERAASLTGQFLAFSRKQITKPQVINLNTILWDMEQMIRRLMSEQIELTIMTDASLLPVWIDPGQIEQVLVNLVVNACDAMPEGGTLTICTRNVRLSEDFVRSHPGMTPGNYVMLAVTDTGVGMNHETLSHIFEPFFTTKPNGLGTGLGLSTCYGIVRQNNGEIVVSSEPGRGTTMEVYIPAYEGTEAARGNQSTPDIPSGSETVLLVEDDTGVRDLVFRVLIQGGYRVLTASNGSEALSMLHENAEPIHMLVTDMVMPQMSGWELANHVFKHHPDIKVLFMSGYMSNTVVHHECLNPEIAFIQKPFSPGEFLRKLRETLDKGRLDH